MVLAYARSWLIVSSDALGGFLASESKSAPSSVSQKCVEIAAPFDIEQNLARAQELFRGELTFRQLKGIAMDEQPERPPAVLVVEDEALIRLTISDYLQDNGFKVLEASSGDEALAIMAAPGFAVDLVFTDVMMPGITDGFALAKWIIENHPEIPVIVTSGDAEKIASAPDCGGQSQFVPKPYDLDHVAEQIRKTLNRRNGAV